MAETINDTEKGRRIRELVEEMKLYNNPQELEEMKKLMKKNVPFMMRGYLLAYLYVTRSGRTAAKPAHQERKAAQSKPALDNAVSFYINIGKISKGSAREMVDFICEKSGLAPEDIVSVAYKQNYSFVYIRKDRTDGVIEAVNGQTYKGRKVKMNFSKEKEDQQ